MSGIAVAQFSERTQQKLEALVDSRTRQPPLAVFDFDNTCVQNDIGEVFHVHLIDTLRYDFDRIIPLIAPEDGQQAIASAWETLRLLPDSEVKQHPVFPSFRAELLASYIRRLARLGKHDTYRWHISLLAGLSLVEVEAAADACVRAAVEQPLRTESIELDDISFELKHGIRPHAPVAALISALQFVGWDVWIVSASNAWIVRAGAHLVGVDRSCVLGGTLGVDADGNLSAEVVEPYTVGQGKPDAIGRDIGRVPDLAAGDSVTDLEMLEMADTALIVDRGDPKLRALATKHDWMIEPASWLTQVD